MSAPGTLFIVAGPIGNLQDITLRALDTLKAVSLIACEDTRQTRKLLDRHGIAARLIPCHRFNEDQAARRVVEALTAGKDVALASDAGTPGLSDPGGLVVAAAIEAGAPVVALPGPNAAVAALSASGLPASEFTVRGFLPHRAGERRRAIAALAMDNPTQVFYESPLRLAAALRDLAEILGPRRAAVVREMTKKFESWHRGPLTDLADALGKGPVKGEICILVEGASSAALSAARESVPRAGAAGTPQREDETAAVDRTAEIEEGYRALLAGGYDRREALRRLARTTRLPRSEVYRRLTEAARRADAGSHEVHPPEGEEEPDS